MHHEVLAHATAFRESGSPVAGTMIDDHTEPSHRSTTARGANFCVSEGARVPTARQAAALVQETPPIEVWRSGGRRIRPVGPIPLHDDAALSATAVAVPTNCDTEARTRARDRLKV